MQDFESNRDFKGIWIPRDVWLDNRLNMIEKSILMEIDSLDCEDSGCFASNEYLADFCQCSQTKVSNTISKLTKLGYVYTQSFNGKTRVLKSCLTKNARQTYKKCEADLQNLKAINIKENNNIDIKKERKSEIRYDDILMTKVKNEEIRETLREFIKMRTFIKKPMTSRALELLIAKLKKMAGQNKQKALDILNNSIVNCWQDIYMPKNEPISIQEEQRQHEARKRKEHEDALKWGEMTRKQEQSPPI